ncbi:hypothetical protein CVT26_004592 [Gymnopilus dilepis]|uniref:Uncharacterized protein n=1 Tax=Gymnopilus dilepis TaxID=231916 RepID=A0A409WC25_9AGAR|nr:hypothetical protein CVT26_004592 [Gymnopilus dilepis]
MKYSSALFLPAILSHLAFASALTINTPSSVVFNNPVLIEWTGGHPTSWLVSFYIYFAISQTSPFAPIQTIVPGHAPGSPPLENLGQFSGTATVWTPDIAQGTSIVFQVVDSTGAVAQSAAVTIL